MGYFEVVGEDNRLEASHETVAFEEIQSQGISVCNNAAKELGEDIEGDGHACHGGHDAHWHDEDEAHGDAKERHGWRNVRWPDGKADAAKGRGDYKHG